MEENELKAAGLEANAAAEPADAKAAGWYRRRQGKGFIYVDEAGQQLRDRDWLQFIKGLRIPPAYQNVWISKDREAALLATGIDAKGRKQYRYHPDVSDQNNQTKFQKLVRFSKVLPVLRQHINQDLRRPGWPREKVLALVVFFLDEFFLRIGNKCYEKLNGSYGITTLRKKHLKKQGNNLLLKFKGKSGVERELPISNRRIARLLLNLTEVPGHQIFTYINAEGKSTPVSSTDVNQYIAQATGHRFTAKDFRTWKGTVLAVEQFANICPDDQVFKAKKMLPQLVKAVAQHMGNTVSVCRKYYIHPSVLNCAAQGQIPGYMKKVADDADLRPAEQAALAIIRARKWQINPTQPTAGKAA